MAHFIERPRELAMLRQELDRIRNAGSNDDRPGRCLLIRGRRRVGKSRLIEVFAQRADVPYLYFTATGSGDETELTQFEQNATESTMPSRDLLAAAHPRNWRDALRQLAAALSDDRPSIVVLDELPYLMDEARHFEGILQLSWDRYLSRKPVLLILIGSDLSMMQALNNYDRPFHQRGQEMVIGPLNPLDLSTMLNLPPAEAFDAALITGGLPLICADWQSGQGMWEFLTDSLNNPTSPLLVSAERSLAAEFPSHIQANTVLAAIGSGERTFGNIARASGDLAATPLNRSLATLIDKRIVAAELPLSTRSSKERRYQITDPYLRFWLQFLGNAMPEIERGRVDLILDRIRRSWTAWRGRAIEPLLREALARRLPDDSLPSAPAIGSYWTRTNNIEIDIGGADRAPIAKKLLFVGSIKWLERSTFDDHDLAALLRHRALLTDELILVVAISRAGTSCAGLDASYGPDELIESWAHRDHQDRGQPVL